VIGMDAVNGELGPDFAALECATVYVVGTGAHSDAANQLVAPDVLDSIG
jgi:hypothetical protein